MEFRLTYQGPLRSTQRDATGDQKCPRSQHKHDIRKYFHPQLKRLWEVTPFLKTGERSGPGVWLLEGSQQHDYHPDSLAKKFALYGFNFVPLVTQDLNLICGLEILFLRPGNPGSLLKSGDIDNRLKTLFDAMRPPEAQENYSARIPAQDEQPFYCLLEDDNLITKVSVETDQLLQVESTDDNEARLVITVRLRPYELHLGNMQFS